MFVLFGIERFLSAMNSATVNNPIIEQRRSILAEMRSALRTGQQRLADWKTGELAVSAVPGAGKSHSMAVAAAITIAREQLHQRRRLIVVTLTRSAAANIKSKIDRSLRELSLPPVGYSVSTIHSLAWSISNSYPNLSGIDLQDRTIITPQPNHKLVRTTVERWLPKNADRYRQLLIGQGFDGEETERLRRQSAIKSDLLPALTLVAVSEAKSSGLSPADLWEIADRDRDDYDILGICAGLYGEYQTQMQELQYLDHDEMIAGALRVLKNDAARHWWQSQIHGVFEDEAQDSSPLQEKLLRILATDDSNTNFIRVGDPNQSINSSYTSADPSYFRKFCDDCDQIFSLARMDAAGRSSREIFRAANFVAHWGNKYLDNSETTENPGTVFWEQDIQAVGEQDPQPNPIKIAAGVEIHRPQTIFEAIDQIGQRLIELFAQEPDLSAAVLVRDNRQGRFVRDKLGEILQYQEGIKINLAGVSDRTSRIPGDILQTLQFITRPHSADNLKKVLDILLERKLIAAQDTNALSIAPERFLYPQINDPPLVSVARKAQEYCRSAIGARSRIPHYQLIGYLASWLEYDDLELASADKLSEYVAKQTFGKDSIEEIILALQEIVQSDKFTNIDEEADELYTASGQVTIATMHKAKGLDWDAVFLPFLHEDIIPGSAWVPKSEQFLGDFNISEVARTKIRAVAHGQPLPSNEVAYDRAQFLKKAEALRLLYVAMTRAKRLLWMSAEREAPFSWSNFDYQKSGVKLSSKYPCPAIPALEKFLRNQQTED
jgi:DNA helicase II / ATP-dependent DNA helicase PcrA